MLECYTVIETACYPNKYKVVPRPGFPLKEDNYPSSFYPTLGLAWKEAGRRNKYMEEKRKLDKGI